MLLNPVGTVVLGLFTKGVVWDDNIFVGGGLIVLPFGNMLLLWIGEVKINRAKPYILVFNCSGNILYQTWFLILLHVLTDTWQS